MSAKDPALRDRLNEQLRRFAAELHELPGIEAEENREALVQQLVDSIHRVEYVRALKSQDISPRRADPNDEIFDPLKASVFHHRSKDLDEAFWLVFLAVQFGKHRRSGWRRVREIYGALGEGPVWSWKRVSTDLDGFRDWIEENRTRFGGGFGNHRQYESLRPNGTPLTIGSYVEWISPPRSQPEMFSQLTRDVDPSRAFDTLYRALDKVRRFGRLAKFDFLAMLNKLGYINAEPQSAYIKEATGPKLGAQLLFSGERNGGVDVRRLEDLAVQLGESLGVGMQEIEDALCNWQKVPNRFVRFRG